MIKFVEVAKIEAKSPRTGSLSKNTDSETHYFFQNVLVISRARFLCNCVTKKLFLQLIQIQPPSGPICDSASQTLPRNIKFGGRHLSVRHSTEVLVKN